ncbi:MAG: hypothetical protein SNH55_03380 [Rikenellaceae bacterium]
MQKIIVYIAILTTLVGCFKDISYNTTIVLKPSQQIESGGSAIDLPGVVAFAFAADTTYFEVTSYDDALAGIMSDKESGEQITAFASSAPYNNDVYGFEYAVSLLIDQNIETIAIVAVDTENGDYGYTTYELSVNLPITYIAVNFAPWKEGKFEYGDWCFVVDEPYTGPEFPEVGL